MQITVCFYSLTGHVFQLAQKIAEGIEEAGGTPYICRVPETLPDEIIEKIGAAESVESMSHIPQCTVDDLAQGEAVIFGTPTRFGNMCGQMRQFLDSTGPLWAEKALVGKIGSVFVSTASQHGGQEATIRSFHITLMHHGMLIAGLPYIFNKQNDLSQVNGCSPYGVSTIAGNKGERDPSDMELEAAVFQGRYVTMLTEHIYDKRKDIIKTLTEEQ
ncbi:MAG: NAD(P)H:quinone oxidoreductase [bacterium]